MKFTLLDFQQTAVDAVCEQLTFILDNDRLETMTLQSPTGSGKTIIATTVIEIMAQQGDIAFLWASVGHGKVHEQSYLRLQHGLPNMNVNLIENVCLSNVLEPGEICVFNWDKVNNVDNVLTREGEKSNFYDLLNVTKDAGTKIILIVDESHYGAGDSSNIHQVKERIAPHAIFNLSATPRGETDHSHVVSFEQVIGAELIKKELYINKDIENYRIIHGTQVNELVQIFEAAIEKRKELKRLNPRVNPLILVQLPNGVEKRDDVERILRDRDIRYDNGKLAVWLSDTQNKINNDDATIKPFDSEVEVLLFKNAVATGWDCTRAQILIKLKASKSNSFEIQTVGRILRMPERKHYNSEALNVGYVYTDLKEIIFEEGAFKSNLINTQKMTLLKRVELELPYSYSKPIKKSILYSNVLRPKLFNALYEAEGIRYSDHEIDSSILDEAKIELKKLMGTRVKGGIKTAATPEIADYIFRKQLKEILGHRGNLAAVKTVGKILIDWISITQGWSTHATFLHVKTIINDRPIFEAAIIEALEKYDQSVVEEKGFDNDPALETLTWSPPEELWVSSDLVNIRFNKYAYDKSFINLNSLEDSFAGKVDDDIDVDWWVKNGDSGKQHFSIALGQGKNFYPDFIVKYKNGVVKIVETKGGHLAQNDKEQRKAHVLKEYGDRHGIETEFIIK